MGTPQLAYSTSHPWISFSLDLSKAPTDLWLLLGEARSKSEHLAGSLLKPNVATLMNQLFLAKGALATTAIEGNTLSEEEAQQAVEGTLKLPPSQEYLAREITNIVDACNAIKNDLLEGGATDLTIEKIKEYNRLVLQELELEDGVVAGEIRRHSVTVARYRGAPASDCEALLNRLCEWLNGPDFDPPGPEWGVPYAIIKAIIAHLYLAWIHPFGDGNGRTARIVELQILLAAGMPLPATHLLSNHYNETRSEYYRQLDQASASGGNLIPFLDYAVQGLVDGLRHQLDMVKMQQFDDRWEQFIYETFGGETRSPARARQLRLVLELSKIDEPVPRLKLTNLTPELAAEYAGKTSKTLSRDLNALRKMGLIVRSRGGFTPNRQVILAFLPVRKSEPSEAA
jgi:cell filamentation protein, protein adenylyltransferase